VVVNGLWGKWVVRGDVVCLWGWGCIPCGYPTAQASQHLPGIFPAPNEPLISHLNGEEGVAMCHVSLLYMSIR